MKRGLVPPLSTHELEPGQAVKVALEFVHPFTEEAPLSETFRSNIHLVCSAPERLVQLRQYRLEYWHSRAVALAPQSIQVLDSLPDVHLRRLLRGCSDKKCFNSASSFTWLCGRKWLALASAKILPLSTSCSRECPSWGRSRSLVVGRLCSLILRLSLSSICLIGSGKSKQRSQ